MDIELLENDVFPASGSGEDRPEGLHVSQIYTDIFNTLEGKEPENWENASEPGFIWEDVFSKAWSDRAVKRGFIFRPLPIQHDGIWVSPDGVRMDVDIEDLVLEEYKFTWKSSNNPPEENWKWMTQLKAYCYVLDIYVAYLRVFHVYGDYRANRRPVYLPWRIEFREDELAENWSMILNHAKAKGWL